MAYKICPGCKAHVGPATKRCSKCGHQFSLYKEKEKKPVYGTTPGFDENGMFRAPIRQPED